MVVRRRVAAAGGGNITYENSNSAGGALSSGALSHAACSCTGPNKVMVIILALNAGSSESILSATYNGVSVMSSLVSTTHVNFMQTFSWVVINPASAATFSVTVSTSTQSTAIATVCYNGVNQSTPTRTATTASGTTNPGSISVTNSQAGDLIVGGFGINDTSAANGMTQARMGADQTFRLQVVNGTSEAGMSVSDEPGATGTVTHSWDFVNDGVNGWGGIAIPLIPAS
jgi:hypothetical protein